MRPPPPSAGRRVDRTFVFIDLSGFTALTNHEGDDRAVAELAIFRWAVREVAGGHGVRIAKWLGDGAMLVGVDESETVSALVALEGHLAEQSMALPLRGGVAGGPTLLFEGDDYIGPAVNLAARLCDEASDHELLATSDLAARVGASGAPGRSVEIRGFDDPVAIVDLADKLRPAPFA